jgi:hypothetical protein
LKDAKRTVEQELVLQKHLSAKYPSKNGLEILLKNVITREKLCSVDAAIAAIVLSMAATFVMKNR